VESDMMIRQNQAVRGEKGAGAAAVEADRRFLQMNEPGLGRLEVVALLEQLAWRPVEEPHAFVGDRCGRDDEEREENRLAHEPPPRCQLSGVRCPIGPPKKYRRR